VWWLGFGVEELSRRSTIATGTIARGNWLVGRPMAELRGARDERPRCTNKRGRGAEEKGGGVKEGVMSRI
jgi:hypothetical protein